MRARSQVLPVRLRRARAIARAWAWAFLVLTVIGCAPPARTTRPPAEPVEPAPTEPSVVPGDVQRDPASPPIEATTPPSSSSRDGRPGLMIPCGGARRSADNPLGLRENQQRGAEFARAFYRKHYQRAQRWGFTRVVWHMPAGWPVEGAMPGAVAVLDAMRDRARSFLEEARDFLARNPGSTVGVYVSGQVPRHYLAADPALAAEWEPYDHTRDDHRALVIDRVIRPLAEAGFSEFWFDHTSGPDFREGAVALFDELNSRYGVHCVMEALPRLPDGRLDADTMRRTPSGAIHRFMVNLWQGDPWPAECEVNVILSSHGGVRPPSPDDMRRYLDAGAVLWSMDEDYDEAVAAVIRREAMPVTRE